MQIFNHDITGRVAALSQAVTDGADIEVKHEPAFAGQPNRVVVKIDRRVLVFSEDLAHRLADQLEANGVEGFPMKLRSLE